MLRYYPSFIEAYYSTGIYPYVSKAMRLGLGWIPFSFGDILYVGLIIMAIRWFTINLRELLRFSSNHWRTLLVALNLILVLFHMAWGFNYYREPLHVGLELEEHYTNKQLQNVTRRLVITSNYLHEQLQNNDSLAVNFKEPQKVLFNQAPDAFKSFTVNGVPLNYGPSSIKKSLLTWPLTYMGYSGYLNPLTGEAQTNANINNYKTPVLILHEMAHQLGYAKENEANFIAVIAGMNHKDLYFQYSASIFALRYCLNDLYQKDQEAAVLLRDRMRPGILKNYQELAAFWEPYNNNVIEKASQATYSKYLEANNQPDGMRTYSYVVALLVNYFDKENN